jgi:hypothetical protein
MAITEDAIPSKSKRISKKVKGFPKGMFQAIEHKNHHLANNYKLS